jgi:hypothetical protein
MPTTGELLIEGEMPLYQDPRAVFADHHLPGVKDKSEDGTKQDEGYQTNASTVVHSAVIICS